jgi:hemerythrin-like domain-containing protein
VNKTDFPLEELSNAANVIKTFIEDYHEKQEEDYLFPRFEKAKSMTALVKVLRKQHDAGRVITSRLMALSKQHSHTENETQEMVALLAAFNNMYRPHEAREDTVLFPAFRKIVSRHEYDSLGEEFEKNEHKKFGEDGFEMMVRRVENIEINLGINELDQFTPVL